MRSPVILGAVLALVIGLLVISGLVAAISSEPPATPGPATASPGSTSLGLYTPSPTAPPTATPTPTMPGAPTAPIGTEVGNVAPRLVLPQLGGGELDTASFAGTPLWLNFMATWCPSCRDELPMMESLQRDVGEEQLQMALVDIGEDERTVRSFIAGLEVDLPVALDSQRSAQQAWGAYALPVHFFIDAEGIVREVVYGGAPREIFVEALQQIVPDADVEGGEGDQ